MAEVDGAEDNQVVGRKGYLVQEIPQRTLPDNIALRIAYLGWLIKLT